MPEPYDGSIFDPVPVYEPWIESFPVPEERTPTIVTMRVPTTGDWRSTGMTDKQWYTINGYREVNKRDGVRYGEYNYDLIDSNGNTVGKVHQGHRVNGEVVPKHAHLYNDPTNIHYWFENK